MPVDIKVSGLPSDSSLDGNHYVPLNDPTGPTTKRTLLSTLAAFFFIQTNIPDGTGSPRTRMTEIEFDFVASGLVWSGDAYASTRNASMTSGVIYINGRRISISAVSARSFTASRDTYVDVLDNADGTGTLVYTEATNNNVSPALAANSVRIAIIVTHATAIADVGRINQGQETKVLPIASTIPYQVTDSLGNLICPRDPNRKTLGYRQITTNSTTTSTTGAAPSSPLSVPVIVPLGRKVEIDFGGESSLYTSGSGVVRVSIWDGAVAVGTQLDAASQTAGSANTAPLTAAALQTPIVASKTYNVGLLNTSAGTATIEAAATQPAFLRVRLA